MDRKPELRAVPLEQVEVTQLVVAKLKKAGDIYLESVRHAGLSESEILIQEKRGRYFSELSERLLTDFFGKQVHLLPDDMGYLREADDILEEWGVDLSKLEIQ